MRALVLGSICVLGAAALLVPALAQRQISGEVQIRQALEKLNTLGSVMMIAAHPDDENTALLAYLARGRHMRTGYLALTRGEGGQNLIGPEQGDEMGVIRTQELLAARKIDGAEQFFTRAIDFGFSKTADETLTKWPREKVLADVVYNIRRFRPDVVILRFTGTPRDGHGHHQSSAILGREAFSLAADPTKFPEQLQYVQTWQPKRLMQNALGGGPDQGKGKAADKGDTKGNGNAKQDDGPVVEVDAGEYSPELGFSYGEIAGMSRSQHRSQAMGTAERMGSQKNQLTTLAGDKATKDIFDGIDTTWGRLPNGREVSTALAQAIDSFVPAHPERLLPVLASTRPKIAAIVNVTHDPWAQRKLTELDEAIALVAGVNLEAQAGAFAVQPGGNLRVTLTAIARSPVEVVWGGAKVNGMTGIPAVPGDPATLANNQPSQRNVNLTVPAGQAYTGPYWLAEPKDGALYTIKDARQIGDADNAPILTAEFQLRVAGTDITLSRPVQHKYVDRVWGELIRPLTIVPPVAVDLSERALVFGDAKPRKIEVPVKSNVGKTAGDVRLELPRGWTATPATRHFDLAATGEQMIASFDVTAPAQASTGRLRAVATVGNVDVASGTETITYPHIPVQTLFPPSTASLVRTDIKNLASKVGYVMGAGDEVPGSLRQMGCEVTMLGAEDLARGDLSKFDTVITGVRAWNTRADLRANYQRLFDYANNGGTVIVQYNTPEGGQQAGGQQGGAQQGGAPAQGAPAATQATPGAPAAPAGAAAPAGRGGRGGAQAGGQGAGQGAGNGGGRGGRGGGGGRGGQQAAAAEPAPSALDHIGPYPIRVTRNDRVTVEEAPVTFPNPGLALLHKPNEITSADFDGWIQERGLYFATEWDQRYQSVLESHDPGEMPLPGGMLYTKYGKGAYIFSAYDWFRELPAGVPGAYRLFANMMSAAKVQ